MRYMYRYLVFCLFGLNPRVHNELNFFKMPNLVVTVEQGQAQGTTKLNYDGDVFYSFQGIPYAKPPVGELRFRAPQPAEPWTGILNATKEGPRCYSRHMFTRELSGSEDCLFINVFTKELPSDEKVNVPKPVMFWIYGGAFLYGSSSTELYGPEFLLTQDVVLVTFNYRLGALGFLSFEDSSLGVPGNAGLKDMVLALKWVQKNIAKFSGDPHNVTIFGESAGAASVHNLLLSPLTKGLFHRAIAQTGCALNFWARGRRCAKLMAEALSFGTTDEREILRRLQEAPVEDVILAQDKILGPDEKMTFFAPVIEDTCNEPAFISEEPLEIIRTGKYHDVPCIFGCTSREGMVRDAVLAMMGQPLELLTDFEKMVPPALGLIPGSNLVKEVAQKIKRFYFGNEEPSLNNKDKEYQLLSDNMFIREVYTTIREQVKRSTEPQYLYRFSLETTLNLFKHMTKFPAEGACHMDDVGYVFKNSFTPEIIPGSAEDVVLRRVVKLWTTFAKNGNPNPIDDPLVKVEWKPVSQEVFNFYDIGAELVADVNPEADRIAFWDELFEEYGGK